MKHSTREDAATNIVLEPYVPVKFQFGRKVIQKKFACDSKDNNFKSKQNYLLLQCCCTRVLPSLLRNLCSQKMEIWQIWQIWQIWEFAIRLWEL